MWGETADMESSAVDVKDITECGGHEASYRRPPPPQSGVVSGSEERTRCRRPARTSRPIGAIAIKALEEEREPF